MSACCAMTSPEKMNAAGACCGAATGAACCGSKACTAPCSTATGGCCDLNKMKLKVIYFNAPARAELVRWMLAYAKAPFEDVRIKKAEWDNVKKNYPTEQLPILEYVDPKTGKQTHIVQSATIVRTVAGFTGLAGRSPHDAIEADQAFECVRDIMEIFFQACFEKDATRKEVLVKKFTEEVLPRMFHHLEKKVKENGGKCLSGANYTYGDFAIARFFDCIRSHCSAECMTKLEKTYVHLATLAKTIESNAEVKAYLTKRPEPEDMGTKFHFELKL